MKNAIPLLASSVAAEPQPIKVDVNTVVNETHVEAQRNDEEFRAADVDGNGYLSQEELTNAFQLVDTHDLVEADQREFFEKMDENLDGKICNEEYRDPYRAFTVLLRKQFEHLDLGNDGQLCENELAIVQQEDKLDTCDSNGDSQIGLTEFIEGSLRTLFPADFVQGNPSEIGVDLDGQPLPKVRLVPAPKGKRYAASVVARDAHIYDPYIKFQDMKRTQGALQSVMGEMGDLMKEAGVDMGAAGEEVNILQALTNNFGQGGGDEAMPQIGEAQKSIEDILSHMDHDQVADDARRLFGRPSLREMMIERESGAGRHLEL